jgi:DNA-binding XRE family transcriptional regulator
MTLNQQNKVLEHANNCTLFDDIKLEIENFCIKTMFFNSVLGRIEQKYTQDDVANYLNISKRTVVNLEKGEVNNIVLILNYIHLFNYDFASKRKNNKYHEN